MCSWCGWDNPFRGRSEAKAVTRLAYLISFNFMVPKTIIKQKYLFLKVKAESSNISFSNIVKSRLWAIVFTIIIKNRLTFETMCIYKFRIFIQGFMTVIRTGKIEID